MDTSLTFGCKSSPALYDRYNKLIVCLAGMMARVPSEDLTNQLDDAVCLSSLEGAVAWTRCYKEICKEVGVLLAPDDGSKGFQASRQGTILGVDLDLDTWTWSLAQDKEVKILRLLYKVVLQDSIMLSEAKTLAGENSHNNAGFDMHI